MGKSSSTFFSNQREHLLLHAFGNIRAYVEAIDSPNHKEWMDAMRDELDSKARIDVWELLDLHLGRNVIGNKWVFKVTRWADGSLDRFKARLMAKGYTQVEGVDYEETFSPMVRLASVPLLLALVVHLDLELFQMDVKTAFLNENLEEEIYIWTSQLVSYQ